MGEFFLFMAAPLVLCVVLVAIHVYLGLHVVGRGVIFVDIALAQVAAVGSAVGLLLGLQPDSGASHLLGFALALLATLVLVFTRSRQERIPQEAFIGITYAVASGAMILILTGVPHGAEEIRTLLVGSILWANWETVARVTWILAALGALHWAIRKPLIRVSFDPERALAEGMALRFWDFVFYASIAWAVTTAVPVAGVLLVFSLLVVPPVMGMMITDSLRGRLLWGWGCGVGVCFVGNVVSYLADLPAGATIVCLFGVALGVLRLTRGRLRRRAPRATCKPF